MGFEVILLGAIVGFFAIRHFTKAEEQDGQAIISLHDDSVLDDASTNLIPEDSSLKRHYLQNLEAERLAITHPHPTEFNLKRHFQAEMNRFLDTTAQSESKPETLAKPAKAVRKVAKAKVTAPKEAEQVTAPEKAKAKPKAATKPKVASKSKAESKPKARPKAEKPKAETKPKTKPKAKPTKAKSESKTD